MTIEKQWLSINPGTFVWTNKNIGLVYDSETFSSFRFKLSERILEICNELLCPSNLNSTIITSEDFSNINTLNWINTLVNIHNLGVLSRGDNKKPVSLKPILKLLNDADFYKYEHSNGVGGSIIKNIHELHFYINFSFFGNDIYFRQLPFPLRNGPSLGIDKILQFTQYCQNPFLLNVNLIGNLFTYPDYKELVEKIAGVVKHVTIKITYTDFASHKEELSEQTWPQNISFNVLSDSIPSELIGLQELNVSIFVVFLVFSEDGYNLINDLINDKPVYRDALIVPVYNGENISFFEDNIYTSREDMDEIKLTKREIFIHQALNSNDFGKLIILPDGNVYANVNFEPYGNIDDSPYSIVYKEITKGKSWLRIRNQEPCSNCIYQWLCPSPSNYELAIGKPNLCHIKV